MNKQEARFNFTLFEHKSEGEKKNEEKTVLQIVSIFCESHDGHHFAGDRNVEARVALESLSAQAKSTKEFSFFRFSLDLFGSSQTDADFAEEAIVTIDHSLDLDRLRVNVETAKPLLAKQYEQKSFASLQQIQPVLRG